MSNDPKYPSIDPGYRPASQYVKRGNASAKPEPREARRPPPIDSGLSAPPLPPLYVEPRIEGHISLWSRRAVTMELTDEEMEFHGVKRLKPVHIEGVNSDMIGYGESTGMPQGRRRGRAKGRWDHLRGEALRLRREEGMSTHAIVRELNGPSRSLIQRWTKEAGLNYSRSEAARRGRAKIQKPPVRDIGIKGKTQARLDLEAAMVKAAALADEGRSLVEISETLGIGKATVWSWLHGRVKGGAAELRGRPSDPELRAKAMELLGEGNSVRRTAKLLGVSRTAVTKWKKLEGQK